MEFSTKIKIAAVLAIIAGPFMTYNGYSEKQRLAKLEKEGVTVDGIIQGGEWRSGGRRRSSSHTFDVAFTPDGGVPVTKSFAVTSSYFSAHASKDENAIIDPAVKVRYLHGQIENSAILVNGSTDQASMFPFGIGTFSVGGLTLLGMLMTRRS